MQTLSTQQKTEKSVLISLVICTRNRAQFLPQHLASLAHIQSSVPWEIIFVDNNSNDDTAQLLAQFAQQSATPVTVIKEDIIGLANARNTGWRASNGEIIAFTDDDCYPDVHFINHLYTAFLEKKVGFVGGRVLLHDPEDLPMTIKLSEDIDYYNALAFIGPGHIHGANFAMRKSLLETIDGFDPLMGSGTAFPCEDCDILLRALNAGVRGKYSPDIVVSHHHRRRTASDLAKIEAAYLAGRGAFYMKAFVDLPNRLRTARMWYHSAKYFGLKAFIKEFFIGLNYLSTRKKSRAANN